MRCKVIIICLFVLVVALTSCGSTVSDTTTFLPDVNTAPKTNNELFDLFTDSIESNSYDTLYGYTSQDIFTIIDKEAFVSIFNDISRISGKLKNILNKSSMPDSNGESFFALLDFENIDLELSVTISDLKICAFTYNVVFNQAFEIEYAENIVERYFVLENQGYKLNAVYTYVNDGTEHPAVLLIPGSGQCDYNETVGMLKPFEDMARGLAEKGINSLRIDKRTLNFSSSFKATDGLEEEYLSDFRAALNYLKKENDGNIFLLGHSLGGQIAAELSKSSDVQGIVLFNSSGRHLADIMKDQYVRVDSQNSNAYVQYANIAKEMTLSSARGYYYYGVSDYYWASYNLLDTVENIKAFNSRSLIINSTYDNQSFQQDIELWQESFGNDQKVEIRIYNDISHFGYKIDTNNISSLYTQAEFPKEIIDEISDFVKETKK